MKPWPLILLLPSALTAQAQTLENGFCIENQDNTPALFVVDAGGNTRKMAVLAPLERLCTAGFSTPTTGFVSVFYDEYAVEGCSRLSAAGEVQVLLKYADFDNCAWKTIALK